MPRTSSHPPRRVLRHLVAAATVGLGASLLVSPATHATPAGDAPVIAEAYLSGGSANAPYTHKFIELHNPTAAAVDLAGWSLQYRSAGGTSDFQKFDLSGTIPAGGDFLIQGGSNGSNGAALPAPDLTIGINPSGTNGTIALVRDTAALGGSVLGDVTEAGNGPVDLLGYGTSNTFETTAATSPSGNSDPKSFVRAGAADSDDNSNDFTLAELVTPCGQTGCWDDEPPAPVEPTDATIAEIQGEGTDSPLAGDTVTTTGVVTAAYPSGGFDGIYLQTAGTGGPHDPDLTTSHGVFVKSLALARAVQVGDKVELSGVVSEDYGLTTITATAGSWTISDAAAGEAVTPIEVEFPLTEVQRESLEGMLVAPAGAWTVTDNYDAHTYGEIGLAAGDAALVQPTDVARPGTPEYDDLVTHNFEHLVTLDDGSSNNYTGGAKNLATPWLTLDNEVRIGAPATLSEPFVLDYRFSLWRFQPTSMVTADSAKPATFGDTRADEATPDEVGGDVQVASFNVLNYFTTTGEDFVDEHGGSCTYYTDREGNRTTVDQCTPNGPRGAADGEALQRQQDKIVAAINTLGADVVGLEEIENSAAFGLDRDEALDTLVAALNADTGETTWAAVPSPAVVPETGDDVIRTAFIHRVGVVETVGESQILDDPAFVNARAPLAQAFRAVGDEEATPFVVIVNHFKSKGSGSGADADQGDGQGASNQSRVGQATALVAFAADVEAETGTDQSFLVGDFNSYTHEDPLQVLSQAGYVNVGDEFAVDATYSFDGLLGSLDHVFASAETIAHVTGADTWNINADESVGREYSRHNANATLLYDTSVFRASDHDPTLVGYTPPTEAAGPVFSDVVGNTFVEEIGWLAARGIAQGYEEADGTWSFRPSESVLREQMAAFLYRLDQLDT